MADVNPIVKSGTVTWSPYFGDADSSDALLRPDQQVVNGTITFYPGARGLNTFRMNFPSIPETLFIRSVIAPIVNSQLIAPESEDLPTPLVLIASDQPAANLLSPMQWVAEFNITGLSRGDQPPALVFEVPADGTIDLATVVPQTPSPAQVLVVDESIAIAAQQAAAQAQQALALLNQGIAPAVEAYLLANPPMGAIGDLTIDDVTDSTTLSQSLVRAATTAAMRSIMGAGVSNLAVGTGSTDAKAGNYQPTIADIIGLASFMVSFLDADTATAARTVLGAGVSDLAIGTTSSTAKAGNWLPSVGDVQGVSSVGQGVITAVSQTAARAAIGASALALGATSSTAKPGDWMPTVEDLTNASAFGESMAKAANPAAGRALLEIASTASRMDVVWDGTSYGTQPSTTPTGLKVREAYGPSLPTYPALTGVLDLYTYWDGTA